MAKCELCGEHADKLYAVPFCDDVEYDEDGAHPQYVDYNVCSMCVPKDMVDIIDDGQEILHNLLMRWS